MCWYCHWGVSKPVAEIYQEALRRLGGDDTPLLYGPAHIVWDDYNFHCADKCIEDFDLYKGDYGEEELAVVRWSLEELLKLPEEVREIEPDDYDTQHPESHPPTVEVVKI
jgi:hypothetical protein